MIIETVRGETSSINPSHGVCLCDADTDVLSIGALRDRRFNRTQNGEVRLAELAFEHSTVCIGCHLLKRRDRSMSVAELEILSVFRRYRVGPAEMLFLSSSDCRVAAASFTSAMRRMIERGLIIKERPEQAYSLTKAGYTLSISPKVRAESEKPRPKRKKIIAK